MGSDVATVTREKANDGKIWFRIHYCCPWCGDNGTVSTNLGAHTKEQFLALLAVCPGPLCLQPALVQVAGWMLSEIDAVPAEVSPALRHTYAEPGVPERVSRDMTEALNCRASGFNLGAATVARRALQAALVDKGANKKKPLHEQINELDDETLPLKLKRVAHQVRLIGNAAAHPEDPDADEAEDLLHADLMDGTDADKLIRFVRQVLHQLYVLPHELDEAQQKRPLDPKHEPKPKPKKPDSPG